MSFLTILALTTLVFIVIYQIAKATEYAAILRGNEQEQEYRTNKLMAWLMLITFLLGMYGVVKCHIDMLGTLLPVAASDHGEKYEEMLKWTVYITGFVFFATQTVLFYFIIKYKATGKRTAFFYPHNNNLEVLWTVVPAIALVILVVIGLRNWVNMTGEPPKNAMVVEITGKQFNWVIRYAGKDGVFGKTDFRQINDATNVLGLDATDKASADDIIIQSSEMRLVVNQPVKLVIRSRDVIHNVGLPHFRMKMDAVPGIINTMWFTPKYTTSEMANITGNPEFVYEISCDQMCGSGHYAMRGTVVVNTKAEFDKWLADQKPYFAGDKEKAPTATDSAVAIK